MVIEITTEIIDIATCRRWSLSSIELGLRFIEMMSMIASRRRSLSSMRGAASSPPALTLTQAKRLHALLLAAPVPALRFRMRTTIVSLFDGRRAEPMCGDETPLVSRSADSYRSLSGVQTVPTKLHAARKFFWTLQLTRTGSIAETILCVGENRHEGPFTRVLSSSFGAFTTNRPVLF